ncbi:MMPL family transporter [Nocardioides rubriscoriae]|uniref:MMPL family transporter n=1 Tax=Nocardioides rubriscoriae TaxID=642762 RepID=UPI0011DFC874|nr:MMPL family transporter [Nocardioides rubriscoriae]
MRTKLDAYGRLAARHPLRVLGAWLLLMLILVGTWGAIGTAIDDTIVIPDSDSNAAQSVQEEEFPTSALGNGTLLFTGDLGELDTAQAREAVEASLAAVAGVPGVTQVLSPFPEEDGGPAPRLSSDASTAYAQVYFDVPSSALDEGTSDAVLAAAQPARDAGLETMPGGQLAVAAAGEPGHTSELIGIGVAAIVLLVALGTAAAMGVPILSALIGLVGGLAAVGLLSQIDAIPGTATTVATMISLGVGIDYALFILVRYRTLRHEGIEHEPAVGTAVSTAGAAVLFAGATVAIGLGGLLLAGLPLLTALGWTAAVGVGLAVITALGVLPAVIGLLGARLEAGSLPRKHPLVPGQGWWRRIGETTARRPRTVVGLATLLLALVIAPVTLMDLGQQDDGNDPTGTSTRASYDLLAADFGPGSNGPLLVVADLGEEAVADPAALEASLTELTGALTDQPGVASVQGPSVAESQTAALWQVVPTTAPSDDATGDLVSTLRDEVLPAYEVAGTSLHVGGQTAAKIDLTQQVSDSLVLVISVVILLSFLLLVLLFRSVVIPLTAAVMNLLSVGAAFGILTLVFQEGYGIGLVGLDGPVPIESFVPLMLFAILFGLSMDYEVFLVSSIAERWHHLGRDTREANTEAVVGGLGLSGRVVTAAALIMFSVFISFTGQDDPVIKMFGLGLGAAVLIDALIVRGLLVPGLMVLLGRSNWWFPAWLDRITPHLDLEGPLPTADEDVERTAVTA